MKLAWQPHCRCTRPASRRQPFRFGLSGRWLLLAVMTLLGSPSAWALGLGQATVQSYLDQPLEARIELISRSEAELATVTASLASAADYRVMGLSPSAIGLPLEFTVVGDLADPHILVRSRQSIGTPVLQLVVEVVWSGGRMLRQYTLFLDPPTFRSAAPLPSSRRDSGDDGRAAGPETSEPPVTVEVAPVPAPAAATTPFEPALVEEALPDRAPPPPETSPSSPAQEPREEPVLASRGREPVTDTGPPFEPVVEPEIEQETDPGTTLAPGPEEGPGMEQEGAAEPEAEAERGPEQRLDASPELEPETIREPEPELDPEPEIEPAPEEQGVVEPLIAEEAPPDTTEAFAPVPAEKPDGISTESTGEAPAEQVGDDTVDDPGSIDQAIDETPPAVTGTEPAPDAPAIEGPGPLPGDEPEPMAEPSVEPEPAAPVAEEIQGAPESAEEAPSVQEPPAGEPAPPVMEPVEEAVADPELPPVDLVFRAVAGPQRGTGTHEVASGETLWGLSRQWAEERGVSVNQMMLAIQRSNPDAFQGENINRMMAGAILRLPDGEEARRMDQRQAMLEVLRQEQAWRARRGLPGEPDDLPSIADLAQQGASSEEGPPGRSGKPDSRLELVPPAEQGEGGAGEPGRGAEQEAGAIRGESMEEELARAQEELANARQENAYLAERLEELERELESARELVDGGAAGAGEGNVADTNLAELEERLRRERQSGARQEEELAVTPRGAEEKGDGRLGLALLALVVLLVGGLVWWFRSTAADDERASSDRS